MDEHKEWFLKLSEKEYRDLCLEWIKANTHINLPKLQSYDEWLNYFKAISPLQLKALGDMGQGVLPVEAYSALTRWADILKSPHRIDKIYQAGLTKPKSEHKSITELASENDEIGVLKALRDQIAEQLEKGTGARDTASLAMSMSSIIQQIKDAERKAGPKKDTALADLLAGKPKRAPGARHGSFKAHTIAEIENE